MIQVPVEVFWPHPFSKDDRIVEHKCHQAVDMEFPSAFYIYSNNENILKDMSKKFSDPYTNESLVAKISILYNHYGTPEKIIVFLSKTLRMKSDLNNDEEEKAIEVKLGENVNAVSGEE
jgi:hypothetical protein